jgi:hypothetical protein
LIAIGLSINYLEETFEYAVALKGDPTNPETEVLDFEDNPEHLAGNPESGRVYRFTPSVVSTEQAETPRFSVYPTIVEQRLNIAGDFATATAYRILSVDGRLVQSGKLTSEIIELGDLARGSYVLHLDGSPKAAKFIKN